MHDAEASRVVFADLGVDAVGNGVRGILPCGERILRRLQDLRGGGRGEQGQGGERVCDEPAENHPRTIPRGIFRGIP